MIILIAEDDAGIRNSLHTILKANHDVLLCEDGEAALKVLETTIVDLVITDNQMPKLSGLELIKRGKDLTPSTTFLLMTAFGSVPQAVEAIRLGADDYFLKPFETTEIRHRVKNVEEMRSWKAEALLKEESASGTARLVGNSLPIRRAQEFIKKVAPVSSPVLLLGPSGSGKEILARAIHESGPRKGRPFVAVNCASLSEQLMESELFGHEKGAFTGATAQKPGKFELASSGTLFLDEMGELSPNVQAKLLRVLQEKEFYRLGGLRQVKSDARVIAATHRPLREMVKAGTFREDLFFRLNVLTLEMAPLSERKEDIPILIHHFWNRLTHEFGRKLELEPKALELLGAYHYPGNIRELQNVLERLVVLGAEKGTIGVEALPAEFRETPAPRKIGGALPTECPPEGLTHAIDSYEAVLIESVMRLTNFNQVKAAERLKITRGALQYKLKKYGIVKPVEKAAA